MLSGVLIVSFLIVQLQNGAHATPELPRLGKQNSRGLESINGSLFYFSERDDNMSMLEAVRTCNSMNMKLLSIQTQQKQNMIVDFIRANDYEAILYWTSGMRFYRNRFLWTGTGELIEEYENWDWQSDEPDQPTTNEACIFLDASVGSYFWHDANCNTIEFGVICEQ